MNSSMGKALVGIARRFLFYGLCLFAPARTFDFWQAWVFLILFSTLFLQMVIHLSKNDPKLLERRSKVGPSAETRPRQKIVMLLLISCHALILITAGFDRQFHWSEVPVAVVIAAYMAVVTGLMIQGRTFRENSFASAIITTMPEQKVIATGPYSMVRHPMYSGAVIVNLSLPVALGSWRALPFGAALILVLAARIWDEEKMLRESLPGYKEYCQTVRYRLLPGVW